MDRWQAMRVFAKVAETGGFAPAARALDLSPPAVTRAVAALEAQIGTRLLVRTTRTVKLTEAGARYYDDCRRILADIDEAEAAAAGSYATPSGTLTITASVLFGQLYVLPIVTEFLDRHRAVTARTLFVDRIVNLIDEGIDVAVRIGPLRDSDYRATRVGAVRRVVVASPSYLARAGTPEAPADLARHDIVASVAARGTNDWTFGRDSHSVVTVKPRLTCNTNAAAIAAAIDGRGLTRVLSYQVAPALAAGQLVAVLDAHEEAPWPIHVVHGEGRRVTAKVRAFVDLAVERLRGNALLDQHERGNAPPDQRE